jgi:hypothetical protein
MNFPFRARRFGRPRACSPREARATVEGFDSYFLLLPSGADGHRDTDRLRLVAGLHGYDAWLLGYRDEGLRHGRQRVAVLPLGAMPGTG